MGYQGFARETQYDPIALNIAQVIEQDEKVNRNIRKGLQENKDLQSQWNSSYIDAMTQVHGVEEANLKENQEWFDDNAERIHKKEVQHLEIALKNTEQEDPTPVLEALTPFLLEAGVKAAGMVKKHMDAKHQEKVEKTTAYIRTAKLTTDQIGEVRSNKEAILDQSAAGESILRKIAKENGLEYKSLNQNMVEMLKRSGVDKIHHNGIAVLNSMKQVDSSFSQNTINGKTYEGPDGVERTVHQLLDLGNVDLIRHGLETHLSEVVGGNAALKNLSPFHQQEIRVLGDKWIAQRLGQVTGKLEQRAYDEHKRTIQSEYAAGGGDPRQTHETFQRRLQAHNGSYKQTQDEFLKVTDGLFTAEEYQSFLDTSPKYSLDQNRENSGKFVGAIQKRIAELRKDQYNKSENEIKYREQQYSEEADALFEQAAGLPKDELDMFRGSHANTFKQLNMVAPQVYKNLTRKLDILQGKVPGVRENLPSSFTPQVKERAKAKLDELTMDVAKTLDKDDPATLKDIQGFVGYQPAVDYYNKVYADLFTEGMRVENDDVFKATAYADIKIQEHAGVRYALTPEARFIETAKGKQENTNRVMKNSLAATQAQSDDTTKRLNIQAVLNKDLTSTGGYEKNVLTKFGEGDFYGQEKYLRKIGELANMGVPITHLLNQLPPEFRQMVERTEGLTSGQVITDGLEALGIYVPSLDNQLYTSEEAKKDKASDNAYLSRLKASGSSPAGGAIHATNNTYGLAKITSHVKAGTDHQHSGANYHEHVGFANQADTANYIKAIKLADKRRGGGWYNITSTFRDGDPGDHGKGSMENPFAVDLSPPVSLPYTEEAESKWRSGMREDLRLAYKELGLTLPNFLLDNN